MLMLTIAVCLVFTMKTGATQTEASTWQMDLEAIEGVIYGLTLPFSRADPVLDYDDGDFREWFDAGFTGSYMFLLYVFESQWTS